MKVMEFSENTKVDCVVPEWAEFMDKGDHISYMPSFKGGNFSGCLMKEFAQRLKISRPLIL